MNNDNVMGTTDSKICIDPLGGLKIRSPSSQALVVRSTKGRALLGYLAIRPDFMETRERLVGLLWSDNEESHARTALRQCLRQLRLDFGSRFERCLSVGRNHIGLGVDSVRSYIADIEAGLARFEVDPRLLSDDAHPERLFYGLEDLDANFNAWIHVARRNWHLKLVSGLERILHSAPEEIARREAAQVLAQIDPSHEPAHRFLMYDAFRSGNPAAALRQYEVLWNELRDQYDSEPQEETVALISAIKLGKDVVDVEQPFAPPASLVTAPRLDRAPRIAVEQVSHPDMSGMPDHIAVGFRTELIASLSRFREWAVLDAPRIDNNVDYTVQTHCQYFGENRRFLLTLKSVDDGQVVWSEYYDLKPLAFTRSLIQIVRRIALALNIYVSAERVSHTANLDVTDWNSFDAWLYGRALSFRWERTARTEAEDIFRRIIRRRPSFAPAFSGLAMLENTRHLVSPGILRTDDCHQSALRWARQAVALDPLDTKAHLASAWSMAMNGQFAQAQRFFRNAYELNQNDAWTLISSALGMAFAGAKEEGAKLSQEALSLDQQPSPSHCEYQANINFVLGDMDAACHWSAQADGATPDSQGWHVASLALLGRKTEAHELAQRFISTSLANWHGQNNPNAETVGQWFLQCHPLADIACRDNLRRGLEIANVLRR